MKLTSPDNLPYPEAGDDLNPLDEWFADLATAVQKALNPDWIIVAEVGATIGAFTAATQVGYRRSAGVVALTGSLYRSAAPSQNGVFTLPAGFRPRSQVMVTTTAAWDAQVQVDTGGGVRVTANQGRTSSPGFTLDGVTFPTA